MKTKLLFALLLAGTINANAQILTSNALSATQLVQAILGPGVSASNITYTGDTLAKGYFNGVLSNLGLDSGIVLSSGNVNTSGGQNLSGATSTAFSTSGDVDITTLAGYTSYDASVLEFDFVPLGDSIMFNFVFGSEEYSEWVTSSFNDAFGFFLSGPGITGPFSSPVGFPGGSVNLAVIPSLGQTITINNINCQTSSAYYICNDPSNSICASSYGCPSSATSTTVTFDGFTTVLTAVNAVQKCHTYHIKMVVGDVMDRIYDSGVFIEAQSFAVDTICIAASIFTPTGNNELCEGDTVTHYANLGAGFYYQWYKDGQEILGATAPSLDIFDAGNYYVLVYSDSFCSKTSEVINVLVNPAPDPIISVNEDTLFSNYATGNQWYLNEHLLQGQTNPYLVGYGSGNYTVKVTDANTGCTGNSQIFNINSIADDAAGHTLKVYPNPADNMVIVEWESAKENFMKISITDIYGKEVYKTQAAKSAGGKQEINIEHLAPGIYIVNANSGNWNKKIKLVRN